MDIYISYLPHNAMSTCQKAARPLTRCLQNTQASGQSARAIRTFATTARANDEAATTTESPTASYKPILDPTTVTNPRLERKLMREGVHPIGSRRRRAALKSAENIPFEQLPYQCFQEAMKVLKKDREQKLKEIKAMRLQITNLIATDPATLRGGEQFKQKSLNSMRNHLEHLKIQADINDPLIKKRFEDGEGMFLSLFPDTKSDYIQAIWTSPSTDTWRTRNGVNTNIKSSSREYNNSPSSPTSSHVSHPQPKYGSHSGSAASPQASSSTPESARCQPDSRCKSLTKASVSSASLSLTPMSLSQKPTISLRAATSWQPISRSPQRRLPSRSVTLLKSKSSFLGSLLSHRRARLTTAILSSCCNSQKEELSTLARFKDRGTHVRRSNCVLL